MLWLCLFLHFSNLPTCSYTQLDYQVRKPRPHRKRGLRLRELKDPAAGKTSPSVPVRWHFFFFFSSTSQWMIVTRTKVWQIAAPELHKRHVTIPKWTAKWEMWRRSPSSRCSLTASGFVIHSRRFFRTSWLGPMVLPLGTLGPECETPTDKHSDHKAHRV